MAPVIIPQELPAKKILEEENVFTMRRKRAFSQDIRPLEIAILNLMPIKVDTEVQLLRLLSNNIIQINITFLHMQSHNAKNTSSEYLASFYKSFAAVKDSKFDAIIVTGAPVEQLNFEDVSYWNELCTALDWAKTNCFCRLFICWGAQAALKHYYNIEKQDLPKKVFGVFHHEIIDNKDNLVRGFDNNFFAPHSRHTTSDDKEIDAHEDLKVLATSPIAGHFLITSRDKRDVFITGHPEYDDNSLENEYIRDINKGLAIEKPVGYYRNNNPDNGIETKWKGHAHLLYANWINYYVYQETLYDIDKI